MEVSEKLAPIYADVDTVMDQHREACRDVETILGVGVLLYRNIRYRHQEWFASVQSKSTAWIQDDAERLAGEFRQWRECSDHWLSIADAFQSQGYEIDHAGRIREYCAELSMADLDVAGMVERFARLDQQVGKTADDLFALLDRNSA